MYQLETRFARIIVVDGSHFRRVHFVPPSVSAILSGLRLSCDAIAYWVYPPLSGITAIVEIDSEIYTKKRPMYVRD